MLPSRLTQWGSALISDIEIRMGRPNIALRMLGEDPARSTDPQSALIGARAYVALGDAAAARRCLRPAALSAATALPLPLLTDSLLTAAAAAELAGDDAEAVANILRACELADGRLVQPFADAHDMLSGVLARHPEASAAWPQPAPATDSEQQVIEPPAAAIRPLPDPLTDRELTVLQRLATTMTTQEIARELCVSINTVKTHIAAIYRKLPAAGRRDAIARARQLEVL